MRRKGIRKGSEGGRKSKIEWYVEKLIEGNVVKGRLRRQAGISAGVIVDERQEKMATGIMYQWKELRLIRYY